MIVQIIARARLRLLRHRLNHACTRTLDLEAERAAIDADLTLARKAESALAMRVATAHLNLSRGA